MTTSYNKKEMKWEKITSHHTEYYNKQTAETQGKNQTKQHRTILRIVLKKHRKSAPNRSSDREKPTSDQTHPTSGHIQPIGAQTIPNFDQSKPTMGRIHPTKKRKRTVNQLLFFFALATAFGTAFGIAFGIDFGIDFEIDVATVSTAIFASEPELVSNDPTMASGIA